MLKSMLEEGRAAGLKGFEQARPRRRRCLAGAARACAHAACAACVHVARGWTPAAGPLPFVVQPPPPPPTSPAPCPSTRPPRALRSPGGGGAPAPRPLQRRKRHDDADLQAQAPAGADRLPGGHRRCAPVQGRSRRLAGRGGPRAPVLGAASVLASAAVCRPAGVLAGAGASRRQRPCLAAPCCATQKCTPSCRSCESGASSLLACWADSLSSQQERPAPQLPLP